MGLPAASQRLCTQEGGRELSDSRTIASYHLPSAGDAYVYAYVLIRLHAMYILMYILYKHDEYVSFRIFLSMEYAVYVDICVNVMHILCNRDISYHINVMYM